MVDPFELERLYRERFSVRGYNETLVETKDLRKLFEVAQLAPSWCNTQPWNVTVLQGDAVARLRKALVTAAETNAPQHPEIAFPSEYPERYLQRRRACGKSLYESMGIERGDGMGRMKAWIRNYELFDAKQYAVVSRPKELGEYATLDVGIWLGYLFTAAASMNIDMCAMAAIAAYPNAVRQAVSVPDDDVVLFGVALGYRDDCAANNTRTVRSSDVKFVMD